MEKVRAEGVHGGEEGVRAEAPPHSVSGDSTTSGGAVGRVDRAHTKRKGGKRRQESEEGFFDG